MRKETYWSKYASDFEQRSNYIIGSSQVAAIKAYMASLDGLQTTLELGCGTGTCTEVLMPAADHYTATDLSDEMIAASKERFGERPGLLIEKADCFDLHYPEHSFDTVVMCNLLHIIPTPELALIEARRVLKPGGRLIVISMTSEGLSLFGKLGMMYRYLKAFGKPSPHATTLTVQSASALLTGAGYQLQQAELIGDKVRAILIQAVPGASA
ncbi:MAG: class I SAM-dependent methyltransferase [Cellvibrionaceae bacterium]|nr:class I SAM-dependent methyltransferase [Cellvibrionaceae bacterium]